MVKACEDIGPLCSRQTRKLGVKCKALTMHRSLMENLDARRIMPETEREKEARRSERGRSSGRKTPL